MIIDVFCTDAQWNELQQSNTAISWNRIGLLHEILPDSEAVFVLKNGIEIEAIDNNKIIVIHQPLQTLQQIGATSNVYKMNAWPTFINGSNWELVGQESPALTTLLTALNKTYTLVQDVIGLIAPRVVSMIINEAYYALEEQVSTKEEIDIAMKLGTNYPYGPFEWCDKIGSLNIYELLIEISKTDSSYTPSILLKQAASK
jgi:3-hydroxybutyryl-CoA dehydrogenase